jgi:hypothetical protein
MYTALRMVRSHRLPLTTRLLLRAVRWDITHWVNAVRKSLAERR